MVKRTSTLKKQWEKSMKRKEKELYIKEGLTTDGHFYQFIETNVVGVSYNSKMISHLKRKSLIRNFHLDKSHIKKKYSSFSSRTSFISKLESFSSKELIQLHKENKKFCKIGLEKNNPYDQNAIIVMLFDEEIHYEFFDVGYLPRELARFISENKMKVLIGNINISERHSLSLELLLHNWDLNKIPLKVVEGPIKRDGFSSDIEKLNKLLSI